MKIIQIAAAGTTTPTGLPNVILWALTDTGKLYWMWGTGSGNSWQEIEPPKESQYEQAT